jgi:hypothetical protein
LLFGAGRPAGLIAWGFLLILQSNTQTGTIELPGGIKVWGPIGVILMIIGVVLDPNMHTIFATPEPPPAGP